MQKSFIKHRLKRVLAVLLALIILLYGGRVLVESTANELRTQVAGKVFSVPAVKRDQLREPYFLLHEDVGGGTLRVLSEMSQPGEPAAPTVEDGYMLYIRSRA